VLPVAHPQERLLVTIPISHYCEKARWALDRAGLAFREERHIQLVHRWAVRRAGGGRTAPVLVTPDGVFADSRAILFYADGLSADDQRLYPADAAARRDVVDLEERFDTVLGVEGRRWVYHQVFADRKAMSPFNLTGVPAAERRAFPFLLPFVAPYIRRYLETSDAADAEAVHRVDRELDDVAARLQDGRRYLLGDRFTAADLAFGALTAPVLAPPQYGTPLPQPDDMAEPMASSVRRWREHPAGAFALRLYREERGTPSTRR
jgi:glutathione S-transferase